MIYKCPKCGYALSCEQSTFRCEHNHCYDKASCGYVNLLLSQSSSHGDDAEMIGARRRFLASGNYSPLRDALCNELAKLSPSTLLDAGCGEGYYTASVAKALPLCSVYGLDISKKAAEKAAKLDKKLNICVASAYAMPYSDGVFDAVINVFSPLAASEYLRVLKSGGLFVMAVPAPEHLIELKQAVYDTVHIKEMKPDEMNGFYPLRETPVKYVMRLSNTEIKDLFTMTPYSRKTSPSDIGKLDAIQELDITASFVLYTYGKTF